MPDASVNYDPDGAGLDNGNFLGLPLVDSPAVRFIAVPYDATVSYGTGTAGGPANVLAASRQLDACVVGLEEPWAAGFAWDRLSCPALKQMDELRRAGRRVVDAAEAGQAADAADIAALDRAGEQIASTLRASIIDRHRRGELPIVVGGEHAVALGAYRACAASGDFGILQIDAHMDLRPAYEGLRYSHASVMHNALELPSLAQLTQVGIRDFAPIERSRVAEEGPRIRVWYDDLIAAALLEGKPFADLAAEIVAGLPYRVWVSLDVDGLVPALCGNTGTPVAGGLTFGQADYLLAQLARSGREILGLDVVEVAAAPHEFEGAVAARLAYRFACRVLAARFEA